MPSDTQNEEQRGRILEALESIHAMLRADGYELDVALESSGAEITVLAGEACNECLVPRAVMEPMLIDKLRGNGIDTAVTLRYPEGHVDA